MWMLLWMKCETIGPAAAAIAESLICWANLFAAASSESRNVTCGTEPALTVPSSLPTPSSLARAGPTPPLVGSFNMTATVPSARFWRTYSTPPSSLTLTSRMLTLPLMRQLVRGLGHDALRQGLLRLGAAVPAADLADELLRALGDLLAERSGGDRGDDHADDEQDAHVVGGGLAGLRAEAAEHAPR